jgi:hypothetical protein
VSIPVDGHVRRTQMADRLQRNDGFFEAYSDVQWLHSRLSWVEMTLPEETEAGSAGKQPARGYFGLRCANGVSGSCWLIQAVSADFFSQWPLANCNPSAALISPGFLNKAFSKRFGFTHSRSTPQTTIRARPQSRHTLRSREVKGLLVRRFGLP